MSVEHRCCAFFAADVMVQNPAPVESSAARAPILDLRAAAPPARDVTQPAVDLHFGWTLAHAALTRHTRTVGSLGSARDSGSLLPGSSTGGLPKPPPAGLIDGSPVGGFGLHMIPHSHIATQVAKHSLAQINVFACKK